MYMKFYIELLRTLALSNNLETRPHPRKEVLTALEYLRDYFTFYYIRLAYLLIM